MTHTEYMRKWRAKNREKVKNAHRKYNAANPEKVQKWKRDSWHRRYPHNREKLLERDALNRKANPEKIKAHHAIFTEIRAGRITKQPCVKCGKPGHAHHEDYSKPLEIIWLCPSHHKLIHLEG